MKRLRYLAVICVFALAAACGKDSASSATTPTPTPTTPTPAPTPTKIIGLPSTIGYGPVPIATTADQQFTISNTGNTALTLTGATATNGLASVITMSFTSGTIPANGSQSVTIHFKPTAPQTYSGVISYQGDFTSGNPGINFNGSGDAPIFSKSGTGNTVFDMPTYVSRVRIIGDYSGDCQNFIVHIGSGASIVNVILGSCFSSSHHYDATALTTGGVVSITNSDGVSWSFTEVRP